MPLLLTLFPSWDPPRLLSRVSSSSTQNMEVRPAGDTRLRREVPGTVSEGRRLAGRVPDTSM